MHCRFRKGPLAVQAIDGVESDSPRPVQRGQMQPNAPSNVIIIWAPAQGKRNRKVSLEPSMPMENPPPKICSARKRKAAVVDKAIAASLAAKNVRSPAAEEMATTKIKFRRHHQSHGHAHGRS